MVVDCVKCSREEKYDKTWKAAMDNIEVIGTFTTNNLCEVERGQEPAGVIEE